MLLDILSNKFVWGTICSAALITGGYRLYLTNMGPAVVTAVMDKSAFDDFGSCIAATAGNSFSLLKYCDKFYLEYLPKKTNPSYKQKIIEVKFFEKKQVIDTYKDLAIWLDTLERTPYPDLKTLTNGQLDTKNI